VEPVLIQTLDPSGSCISTGRLPLGTLTILGGAEGLTAVKTRHPSEALWSLAACSLMAWSTATALFKLPQLMVGVDNAGAALSGREEGCSLFAVILVGGWLIL